MNTMWVRVMMWITDAGIPPDPTPAAPPLVTQKVNTLLGFIKYLSLASAVAALLGFGMLVWASERGGMGSGASEMKERFGKVLISVVIVLTAASIVSFVAT